MIITKKSVTLAAIFLGVVLITLLIIVELAISRHEGPKCQLSDVIPQFKQPDNVAAQNYSALAAFSGYLSYESKFNPAGENNTKHYLELELSQLDRVKPKYLVMDTGCAKLDFVFNEDTSSGDFSLKQIDVLECKGRGGEVKDALCTAVPNFSWPRDKHFACRETLTYACWDNLTFNERVANLTISSLDIELSGDVEDYKKGKYSHKPYWCYASD